MSITGTQPVTFTSPSSQAADYRIYGPLPAGDVVLSVRTPRTRNLLPFPYRGFWQANSDDTWGHYTERELYEMILAMQNGG